MSLHAAGIQSVVVSSLSQFESSDSGSNFGVGWSGWDSALEYARVNGLDYFGSVFLATGDDENPKAFQYGMWNWGYYVRMDVKFDTTASPSPDERAATLADDFMSAILDPANIYTITPTGAAKVVAANYLGAPEVINDVVYLVVEFLVRVKDQIPRG